jgi:NAD(P)-dependent dehydrogenase (short-subunit alcohol dehydrogenase family)
MTHVLDTPAPAARDSRRAPREIGTVLVTGAASGLGRAVAAAVHAAGGRPLLVDRADCVAEAARLGDALTAQVDLADTRAAERAVTELAARAGGLDAVVGAPGPHPTGPRAARPRAPTPAAGWPMSRPPTGSGWCRSTWSAPRRSSVPRYPPCGPAAVGS